MKTVGYRDKYKIAILVPNFISAGGDAQVAKLQANALSEQGNEVSIFTNSADMTPDDAQLFVMGMPKSLFLQRLYRLIFPLDIIKTFYWLRFLKRYDVVIAHLYPMTWLGFLARKVYNIPYIFWFHGTDEPENFNSIAEKIYIRIFIFLTKVTVKDADKLVAVSNFGKVCLKKIFGKDSEVIYNTVDPRFHKGIKGEPIRKKHNLGNSPVILSVGRIMPQKGFDTLIDVFDIIRRHLQEAKLVIVGQQTYADYFRKLKNRSGNSIIFAGHIREELPHYYAMCDVYATCSFRECHNLPVLEAQACGKPVVAFDFDFFREELGKNDILVEKGNIQSFAEACIKKLREVTYDTKNVQYP